MNREEYRLVLGQLPIDNPTEEEMARMCPHLTQDQAVVAFTTGYGYVACPSLFVRDSFQILFYCKESVEENIVWRGYKRVLVTETKKPKLICSYAGRTPASYIDDKLHTDDFFGRYANHKDEAIKFAKYNWGADLVLDDWVEVFKFHINYLVNDRYHTDYPCTESVLYVTLNRYFGEILNDHSKPKSLLFDEAISQMTLDPFVWHELIGERGSLSTFNCAYCGSGLSTSLCVGCERGSLSTFNCAYCGSGLSTSLCVGCGRRFRYDGFRCSWGVPLSRKMVAFLRESGHEFAVDPEIVWKQERDRFKVD